MTAIRSVAVAVFRESVRDRVFYKLVLFAVLLVAASILIGQLTAGQDVKIIKDFGLATIDVFGVLTSVFIGIGLVSREIERRTVHTLLAKPVRRFEFILGKYAGLSLTLLVNTTVMTAWFFLVLLIKGMFDARLGVAVLLLLFQFLLITALAVLFSCLSTPILASVMTLALYVIGHLLWSLDLLSARLTSGSGKLLCRVLYYLLPNLGNFDIKGEVVHGLAVAPGRIFWATVYLVLYGSAVLWTACAVFERKELP